METLDIKVDSMYYVNFLNEELGFNLDAQLPNKTTHQDFLQREMEARMYVSDLTYIYRDTMPQVIISYDLENIVNDMKDAICYYVYWALNMNVYDSRNVGQFNLQKRITFEFLQNLGYIVI